MYKSDKYFWGIVGGIVLILTYFVIVQLSSPYKAYVSDDTRVGVVYNYLLALHKGDYERAYGYLSPRMLHYPRNVAEFTADVKDEFPYDHDRVNGYFISIDSSNANEIIVDSTRGTYSSRYDDFGFQLVKVDGEWKIANEASSWWSSYEYFDPCWIRDCN